jgi:hypothetical protein
VEELSIRASRTRHRADEGAATQRKAEPGASVEPDCWEVCAIDRKHDGPRGIAVETGEPVCQEGASKSTTSDFRSESEVDELDGRPFAVAVEQQGAGVVSVHPQQMPGPPDRGARGKVAFEDVLGSTQPGEAGSQTPTSSKPT